MAAPRKTRIPPLIQAMLDERAEKIVALSQVLEETRLKMRVAQGISTELSDRLGKSELANQEIANKWRLKVQPLENELKLAQRGITSGCGCPIGACQRRSPEQGACWMQWVEAHIHERFGRMRKNELAQAGNHPSRLMALPDKSVP